MTEARMGNHITASILFSFRGQTHTPSVELDLDRMMREQGGIPDLYPLIATANGFDLYSYEYEMMLAEPIRFSQPQGLVSEFIHEQGLDTAGFEAAWKEQQLQQELRHIAQQYLPAVDEQEQPRLMEALRQAYLLGKKSRND